MYVLPLVYYKIHIVFFSLKEFRALIFLIFFISILKTLLAELIEKSVDGKNHPKLLLRRLV